MSRILLSYRRADTAAILGRIFDRLVAEFGKQSVFMDIDNVPIAKDFREYVNSQIAQSNIVVAVMGPQWLRASSADQSRLDNPEDFVRLELRGHWRGKSL
jgi:TIR domain